LTNFAPTLPSVTLMSLRRLVPPHSPLTPNSLTTTLPRVRCSSLKQPSPKTTRSSPWQTTITIQSWIIRPLHSTHSVVTSSFQLTLKQLTTPSPFTKRNSLTSLAPSTPSPTNSRRTPMIPSYLNRYLRSSILSGSCWATSLDRCPSLAAKEVFTPSPRSVLPTAPLYLQSMTWQNAADRLRPFWPLRNQSSIRRRLRRSPRTSNVLRLSKATPAKRVATE
ncbi:hypothetical protein BGW38_010083, partial [Lunasporangiospora selenospora]